MRRRRRSEWNGEAVAGGGVEWGGGGGVGKWGWGVKGAKAGCRRGFPPCGSATGWANSVGAALRASPCAAHTAGSVYSARASRFLPPATHRLQVRGTTSSFEELQYILQHRCVSPGCPASPRPSRGSAHGWLLSHSR